MHCMICGSGARFAFRSAYVDVAQCVDPACRHLFAQAAAPDDGVQSHSDPVDEEARFERRNERLVRFFVREGFLSNGSRVLDVGAGAGHVSNTIASLLPSATIACVEADPSARAHLETKGWIVRSSLDACEGVFDALLLIEVIEHVTEPVTFLRQCAARLAPGGRIFLSTPCGELRNGSRRTNAYDTKEHVHFFTERSLRKACGLAGLTFHGFRAVGELYPRRKGAAGAIDVAKSALRPFRNSLFGYSHLVTFLTQPTS